MSEQREVVVVGGGIAGLTAGHALRDRDVVVLEAADRVGGRIRSEPRGDNWLNFGAHVFGGESSVTGGLLTELGVRAEPVPGRLAAVSLNGKLVSSGPGRELSVPAPDAGAVACRTRSHRAEAAPCGAALRRDRGAAGGRGSRRAAAPDARVHGRPLLLGFRRDDARGRRPAVPVDADALVGRAGGARRRLRGRLLPPRLGQEGRPLPQHPRRLGRLHRHARRRARRSCEDRRTSDEGRGSR